MAMIEISYEEARPLMKAGDVIAFSGKAHFSEIIQFATRSNVSHVGVILQTQVKHDDTERFFNQIIESASLHGFNGVTISRLSDRLSDYEGEIWWLQLRQDIRDEKFDQKAFYDFLFNQAKQRKGYDVPQAIRSALDALDQLPLGAHGSGYNREDFSRFFCSELVAAALEVAGAVPPINASEVTPIDLCRWNIYEPDYYLLKGDPSRKISRYNSLDPSDWRL
jgi:hypothetical protein